MSAVDFHTVLTVLFFVVFIGMVIWVYLPGRKGVYQQAAQLPLEGESKQSGESARHE